jgi:hypothetical protein
VVREVRGYPILFGHGNNEAIEELPRHEVYLAHRTKTGSFTIRKLFFSSSPGLPRSASLRNVLRLNLSPDANYLLVNYSADTLPAGWADQPFVRYVSGFGTFLESYVVGLYEIKTSRLRVGFSFPAGLIHTTWSQDSRSYSVVGPSPFGTDGAKAEAQAAAESGNILTFMNRFQHVFVVDVETGAVSTVLQREGGEPGNIKFWKDLPLSWKHADGPMLVRAGDNAVVWLAKEQGQWKETERFNVLEKGSSISSLASDGKVLVGVSQSWMTPPDLFLLDLQSKQTKILTEFNPLFLGVRLGQVEEISWANRYGSDCKGILVLPVGYEPGKRYPMVFLGTATSDEFFSDVPYASTAFAPQSLATTGFLVLISQYPLNDKTPKGEFPGEMSEAYNWMGMVESAVDLLVDRGLADKGRVGLAGFSRTSWLTDFVLTHSAYHFAAASSADGGIYSYGGYFRYNSEQEIRSAETQVGGPPYGESFRYWQSYAPAFNVQEVEAPILMEYTGTAEHGFEFFTALNRLAKAVELYRYPTGDHPLDTPLERFASLRRNLDWFRFWMQAYEGAAPDYDPKQYARWRALRSRAGVGELR